MAGLDDVVSEARAELATQISPEPLAPSRLRRRGRWRRAAAGLALAGAAALLVADLIDDPAGQERVVTGPPTDSASRQNADLLEPGEWRLLPEAPVEARSSPAVVWTGAEMVVWGGEGVDRAVGDGAAYDPRADRWRTLADAPIEARSSPGAVWTGDEMIVWGGVSTEPLADGAAYDPNTDSWRLLAPAPIPGAGRPVTLWTGSEVLVVGGINERDAAAYDPAADSWREIEYVPGRLTAPYPQGVWTGDRAVFAFTIDPGGHPGRSPAYFSYDPAADEWEQLPALAISQPRVVWTGGELLVIDGSPGGVSARWNPEERSWEPLAATPSEVRAYDDPVTTGDRVLFWGRSPDGSSGLQAALLHPESGRWQLDETAGSLLPRESPPMVWADGVMVSWGGFSNSYEGSAAGDGILYRPPDPVATTHEEPTAATLAPPTSLPPDRMRVSDGSGSSPGTIDLNGPPATYDGRILPVLPVTDDEGRLVGYFGCGFLERAEVERDDFDLDETCPPVTTIER